MESNVIPSKIRRLETPLLSTSDEDCTEDSTEGHAVVHLNVDLLHRIKQEPVDCSETPEVTCVALQKDFYDSSFRETFLDETRPDSSNDNQGYASPTIPMMNEMSAENESGLINERIYPCIRASPAIARTQSRRSLRKRSSVQRSSPEIEVSSSSSFHNLGKRKQSKNSSSIRSVRKKRASTVNQPAFRNSLVSEGSPGSIDADEITGDASDVFKRRFRKMLKDLVAKRMLKLQHSAVYCGTVSALRRKVAILERRNMQLEDKADRLQTSMMNLYNEKEKEATKTVSRGTQVSMGMILSRAWSACQGVDKASSFALEEHGSSSIPGDGPVIIKVCGKQVNDASARVQIPKLSEIMRENTSQKQMESQQCTHSPQTDSPLPKIQHVSSGGLLVSQQPRQHPCDFILPEHRLLSNQALISQSNSARPLQGPNLPSPSSGINSLPVNRQAVIVTDQPGQLSGAIDPWRSISSTSAQQHATGPVNRIATVRPQQVISSSENSSVGQNVPLQTAQMPILPRPRLDSTNLPITKDNTDNISTIIRQITPPVHPTDSSSSRPVMTQTQDRNASVASMLTTAGRRRRPPGGCFCCPPDTNQRHTVGNQNPARGRDDLHLHTGGNHEAPRGQLSNKNQVSTSISTSGARTHGIVSELRPTIPLPYPQQFRPGTQTSNKSSCSVPTGEPANKIRSSSPNRHHRPNVLLGHVNFPRAGMLCPQALPTTPDGTRSAQGNQLVGGLPPQISSQAVPNPSEIQIGSSGVQNPLNQEWSKSHYQNSIRASDQPVIPLNGVDLHPASHPVQRQMFHFTKEQTAHNTDGGYSTTSHQCSPQLHPQQQNQLLTQPSIHMHQQQVPLLQHPPRQELQQQQHRPQPQQQQQLQKQLHQYQRIAGYVPPTPILPKPHPRAHQYWQRNPQFTVPSAAHCGTSFAEQLPASLITASSNNFCLNQRPPIQTQFLRPYPAQNIRNGAFLQQSIQPPVHQSQSSVHTSSTSVSQLSVSVLHDSNSVSPQRERVGAGSILHGQVPYSANARACVHPNASPSSLALLRRNNSDRDSAREGQRNPLTMSNAESGHLLERRTSFTTPNLATISILPANSFRSTPQNPSMPSGPLLNSQTKTVLPATRSPAPRTTRLRNAQGSELKSNEVTAVQASCPATALSPRTGCTTRSLLVQNLPGMKLLDDFKDVTNPETEGNNKQLDSHGGVVGQIVSFSDVAEQGDNEGSQLQKDNASYLKPILGAEQSRDGIVLSWDLTSREYESKVIKYELFVTTASSESTGWQSLGVVDALALPMACTMTQFLPGASYYFTVRAITDVDDRSSELFSQPCSITVLES